MQEIYLDYNATTPLDEGVIETIHRELKESWGNPSSSYSLGRKARSVIETAREQIGKMLGTDSSNIIFTSGGTESNNMAILSVINENKRKKKQYKPHVISSSVEHDATIKLLQHLFDNKEIELSIVNAPGGKITPSSVLRVINEETCLITIMMANNETGVLFPVSELAKSLKAMNDQRKSDGLPIIFLHTDGAQVLGKLPVDVEDLKVDYFSIVGHKFYGPRIGCLYFRKGVPLNPIFHGGGQENGMRPGTENTPMIAGAAVDICFPQLPFTYVRALGRNYVGYMRMGLEDPHSLGEAARLITENIQKDSQHMQAMRDLLAEHLRTKFCPEELVLNFMDTDTLPNTLSISFTDRSGRDILSKCRHVIASTGAACHSSQHSVSRVIKECLDENLWIGTIRLSVGRHTTPKDIINAVNDLHQAFVKTVPH